MDNQSYVSPRNPKRKAFGVLITGLCSLVLLIAIMQIAASPVRYVNAAPEPPYIDGVSNILATDLEVAISVDTETVRPGDTYTFQIAYTNTKSTAVANVVLTNSLSSGQIWDGSYTSNPNIPSGSFSYSGNEELGYLMVWQIGSLAAYGSGTISLQCEAGTLAEPRADDPIILLGSSAIIESSSGGVSGDDADAVTMVTGPVLEIDKEVGPNYVVPGHILAYTLTISNLDRMDSIAATGIVVSDTLPEFSDFYEASHGGGYNGTMGAVLWTLAGPLNPGESIDIFFSVRVNVDAVPGKPIHNNKTEYHVKSSEMNLAPVDGESKASVTIGSLLQKTAKAATSSAPKPNIYPGELVTYTVTVWNPLTDPLDDVTVTDTLPGIPMPFIYKSMVGGGPTPVIGNEGQTLTWVVDLPAWGSVSFSFVAEVPRQTYIPCNRLNATYYNILSASHDEATFITQEKLAPILVVTPIEMDKSVDPNHGNPGDIIIYTIELENHSPYLIDDIVLTDTLEGGFRYIDMDNGPAPVKVIGGGIQVVWQGLSVGPGETYEMSFEARINGIWLEYYYNNLDAYSPDSYIPCRTGRARVKVDSPLGINKTVSPETVFVNTEVHYTIQVTNFSTATWTLAEVMDDLPDGFYQVGGGAPGNNTAVIEIPTPVDLDPEEFWSGELTALVTTDVACDELPKTFKNEEGYVIVHLTYPNDIWAVNAVPLAPLLVKPNISVDLIPYRKTVMAGDVVSMTLHMWNQSSDPANDSIVQVNLHNDITYHQHVSGPMPFVDQGILTWDPIDIPANTEVSVVFLVVVNPQAKRGTKANTYTAEEDEVCYGKLGSGPDENGDGKIYVEEEVVELTKKEITEKVPPLALVEYEIKIQNKDYYPFLLEAVTDTLPEGFTYYNMRTGPQPEVQGNQLIWHDVLLQSRQTLRWKIRLQASALYGTYYNTINAYTPDTIILEKLSEGVDVMPLFDLNKEAGVQYVKPGGTVPYTITLINVSDTNYSGIVVTDTLPTGFTYIDSKPGYPRPIDQGENMTELVWKGLVVKGGCDEDLTQCTLILVINVKVGANVVEGTYYNTVMGDSDTGSIPGPIQVAPVTVTDSPPPPPPPDLGYNIYLPSLFHKHNAAKAR